MTERRGVAGWRAVLAASLAVHTIACGGSRQSPATSGPAGLQARDVADAASRCRADFDFVHTRVTRDYAGYRDGQARDPQELAALTARTRSAVASAATDSACTAALSRWIAFFGASDHHLQLWQPPAAARTASAAPSPDTRAPSLVWRADSLAVLRLPSFSDRYKAAVDSVLAAGADRLRRTPHLVVDVRGNGGGWTGAYAAVLPLLYTRPIRRDGLEIWVSPGNIDAVRRRIDGQGVPPELRAQGVALLARMQGSEGRFVAFTAPVELRFDTVHVMPRAVALVADRGCASSCEEFLLEAMQSDKATLFARERTAGLLDYGNAATVTLPSGIRRFQMPTARSTRLPARAMDTTGIVPHVRVPPEEPDPVAFAARRLGSGSGWR